MGSTMDLTAEEQHHLMNVMKRANEEYMNDHERVRGQLSKFTNALRGFQYRFFVLDPVRGTLEYYLPDDVKRIHPRGFIILSGSIITPSDEDGQTFSVCSSSGEVYKLKAADSKERQFWVDRLRQVSQNHELRRTSQNTLEVPVVASLDAVREILLRTKRDQKQLETSIENYSVGDRDLLTLKALSQTGMNAMEQCYSALYSCYHP